MCVSAVEVARVLPIYGLPAVLLGTFLEGEAVLLTAGVLAERGMLHPVAVWLVASVGAWTGHLTWFSLARLAAARPTLSAALRWTPLAVRLDRVDGLVRDHPTASIFALQYLYGVRLVGAFALGLTRLSWRRFLVTEAFNCLLWAALFTGTGYAAGRIAAQLLQGWLGWAWVAISLGVLLGALHLLSRRGTERLSSRRRGRPDAPASPSAHAGQRNQ